MGTNFWELLHQRQDQLTRSGHAVADYLLQHADEAQYLSISSLARECNVAEATVFRFCRALGFDGYHEMRIALAQANATGVLVNQQEPAPDADTATLCEHASALFMTAINGTQNALSTEAVDEAVHLMQEARQVFCLGQGGSMLLANDICARFASLSTKFRTAGDSHLQLLTASLMNEADVVLFVSYSGATRDMMETLRTAKAAGAKIILLTHYEDSPGALLADVVLLCGAQESPLDSGSIPIKVAVLYVAEVLVLRYILDDKPGSTEAQERTTEALDAGANDYVTKPFSSAELLARIRSALRTFGPQEGRKPGAKFVLGDLRIDYEARRVCIRSQDVRLTQTEYNIVAFLSEHCGKMMTYSAIAKGVWGYFDEGCVKRLQVNMANIRRKFGVRLGENRYIANELGVGYRMNGERDE